MVFGRRPALTGDGVDPRTGPMHRRLFLLACAALFAGCPSVQQQYVARRNVSCEEANRYAFSSVRSLGYTVGEFRPATTSGSGTIKANRTNDRGNPESVTVAIHCEPSGVEAWGTKDESPLKQDQTFSRGFFLAFTGLIDNRAANAAEREQTTGGTTSGGVKFEMRPQLGLESKLDFGEDLAGAGIVAVKVTIQNGSNITYRFDPAKIELRNANDDSVTQVPLSQAASALAKVTSADAGAGAPPPDPARAEALLRERALAPRTLKPGDRVEGFVYFPTGTYTRGRATLVDTATDENEGFLVEF